MADRELIAAIILAGLLAKSIASPDDLVDQALKTADKLINAATAASPGDPGPHTLRWEGEERPPGTP